MRWAMLDTHSQTKDNQLNTSTRRQSSSPGLPGNDQLLGQIHSKPKWSVSTTMPTVAQGCNLVLDSTSTFWKTQKVCHKSTCYLHYYNVTKPVTLTCDTSQYGLRAACLQDGKPVAYASRTLTQTEIRYAQIEKGLLAVVFACYTFYDYICGKPVTVETAHQPLLTIHNKSFHTVPACLQCMRLQKFNLTLIYKRWKHLYLAYMLSRAPRHNIPL